MRPCTSQARDPRLLEALEACRFLETERDEPEMRYLAEQIAADPALKGLCVQIERFDRRVAEAFRDVSAPADLAGRILERLAAAAPVAVAVGTSSSEAATPSEDLPLARPRKISRRWAVGGLVGAAVAASILAASVLLPSGAGQVAKAEALDQAVQAFAGDAGGDWRLIAQTPPPARLPLSADVHAHRAGQLRWRAVTLLGTEGVAYDVTHPGGRRATLYVSRATVAGLRTAPALNPDSTTRGISAAAWQEGGLVYLLVVDGGPQHYRRYLNVETGPVT